MATMVDRMAASDHPRIRGEHSRRTDRCPYPTGSSPHTRGALLPNLHRHARRRIIPAYAGSTFGDPGGSSALPDHPRIRGEHPPLPAPVPDTVGSSPHTRGAPFADYPPTCTPADHPRIRGEHSSSPSSAVPPTGSSPHTRGARTPSHRKQGRRADHPRIRGEHARKCETAHEGVGSSPHTRGARPPSNPHTRNMRDHPRIRGEHANSDGSSCLMRGSSPHTRGALDEIRVSNGGRGIIPAYAGSTPGIASICPPRSDHPRIRGEHQCAGIRLGERSGSSPHTRGAHERFHFAEGHGRIIPAYAGSTTSGAIKAKRRPDHPRIRGEHRPS